MLAAPPASARLRRCLPGAAWNRSWRWSRSRCSSSAASSCCGRSCRRSCGRSSCASRPGRPTPGCCATSAAPTVAAVAMTVLVGAIFVLPFVLVGPRLAQDAASATAAVKQLLQQGPPAPPDWTKDLPVIGSSLYDYWIGAQNDTVRFASDLWPYITDGTNWVLQTRCQPRAGNYRSGPEPAHRLLRVSRRPPPRSASVDGDRALHRPAREEPDRSGRQHHARRHLRHSRHGAGAGRAGRARVLCRRHSRRVLPRTADVLPLPDPPGVGPGVLPARRLAPRGGEYLVGRRTARSMASPSSSSSTIS